MISKNEKPVINHLFSRLSGSTRQWLIENSTSVELVFGESINIANEPITDIYFPITGFVSLLAEIDNNQSLEMGLIGNEGMSGATIALGNLNAPMNSIVQGSGSALRMDAAVFLEGIKSNLELEKLILKYLFVLIQQLAQTGACNRFHEVKQRLARWLLATQDRQHSDHLHLTHQFLSQMLGVRRSAVTIAAGSIQEQGIIAYKRGLITVKSRAALEKVSCSCYKAAIHSYRKHLQS